MSKLGLTDKQKDFLDVIEANTITICEGLAGTGKTLTALSYAIKALKAKDVDSIIVVRTPVENNMDKIGFLPDTVEAKLEPHFASARNIVEMLEGKAKASEWIGKSIHFKIPNFMLGCTFDNTIVIVDEAQELQPLILKMILERTGLNSKVIVIGDPSQLYSQDKTRRGLSDAIRRFFKDGPDGKESLYDKVGYFKFGVDDVVRSDIVKTVIEAYSK